MAKVASSRSTASTVPSQPKSRAVTTDRRYRPILVGEVRWATAGTGSSWKLSGGSMWSAARHEGFEVPPGAPGDQSQSFGVGVRYRTHDLRPEATGWSIARAPVTPTQSAASGSATASAASGKRSDEHRQDAEADTASHHPIKPGKIEPRTASLPGRP